MLSLASATSSPALFSVAFFSVVFADVLFSVVAVASFLSSDFKYLNPNIPTTTTITHAKAMIQLFDDRFGSF